MYYYDVVANFYKKSRKTNTRFIRGGFSTLDEAVVYIIMHDVLEEDYRKYCENNESVHSYIVKYSTGEVYDETLANAQYYVKGNSDIKEKVKNNVKSVENINFTD